MRVRIKDKDTNINIPIPMWVLTSGLRIAPYILKRSLKNKESKFYKKIVEKGAKNSDDILSHIDFKELIKIAKELKKYKGLKIVEINSKDGDYVSIEV